MPQTNPFHSVVPRKLSDSELARAIRVDMEAEMDAINLYAAHIEATDNEEAKAILRHVMDEEREHAALFLELLKRLDPDQQRHLEEAPEKYRLIVSGAPEDVVESVGDHGAGAAGNGAEGSTVPKTLTVGMLGRRSP